MTLAKNEEQFIDFLSTQKCFTMRSTFKVFIMESTTSALLKTDLMN